MITAIAFVGLVAMGAVARWQATEAFGRVGTLSVNVVASFAVGVLAGAGQPAITALGTGGLGALSTVSGLVGQIGALAATNRRAATMYALVTLVLGVATAWAGLQLS